MVCGLETREAIFDKAQQWMKFSHSASRNGIAPFSQRLHAGPSHSDSEVLWGLAGQAHLEWLVQFDAYSVELSPTAKLKGDGKWTKESIAVLL